MRKNKKEQFTIYFYHRHPVQSSYRILNAIDFLTIYCYHQLVPSPQRILAAVDFQCVMFLAFMVHLAELNPIYLVLLSIYRSRCPLVDLFHSTFFLQV